MKNTIENHIQSDKKKEVIENEEHHRQSLKIIEIIEHERIIENIENRTKMKIRKNEGHNKKH